jgi:hypothetical protein
MKISSLKYTWHQNVEGWAETKTLQTIRPILYNDTEVKHGHKGCKNVNEHLLQNQKWGYRGLSSIASMK